MLGALLIALPITAIFLIWFYLFRNKTDIPVSPGAKPLVGHMHMFFDVTAENVHKFEERYFEMTHPRNGPISHIKFFFKSNLSLNTVEVAEPLWKSNVNIDKSFQYDAFSWWIKDSVLVLPGKEWQKRRHLLTPAFHFNILDDFAVTMKKAGRMLVENVKANPKTSIVNIVEQSIFLSICETSFGVDFNEEEAKEILNLMFKILSATLTKTQNILSNWDWYFRRSASGKQMEAGIEEMNKKLMELVDARKKDLEMGQTVLHKGKRGFLDQLVYEQKEHGELTDEQIVGECNTIMLAGNGTTLGTVSFCIYFLCKHPQIQERLFTEIKDHLSGKEIDDVDCGSLQYLGMVVKETLRIQPPGAVVGRRLSEPMEVAGHILPAGTNLDISIWWVHRDPEHWDDPEVFDPERFTPENSRNRNPYAFVPFAAGPRNCIGQRFALLEAKLLIAYLVYNFKMSTEQELGKDIYRTIHNVAVSPGPNFKVKMDPRL